MSKSFPEVSVDAVVDCDLRVEAGSRLVLVGPSGSGKTTVLRLLAGLDQPDKGDIRFDDQSMAGVRPEKRGAAMVFQEHALFPYRTVGENVDYGLKIKKVPRSERTERVGAALAAVHLEGFEGRWPDELSGGQRQRVALARAIVVEPRVLLLDEPLSSIDAELRAELQTTICDVQRARHITTVIVTHDQDEARTMADVMAVLIDGRVRQCGAPDDVFADPVDADVARFLGSERDNG